MNVPFFKPSIDKRDQESVLNVLNSGWLTTGKVGQQFEQDFAKFIGVKFCVAVNSATAALHLSILASSIKAGDYVLVPTMTFASTAEVLYYCGVKPLLIDCNLKDLSISLEDAERKIQKALSENKRVTGIIPVHYAGKMVSMDEVDVFAERFNLQIIEDAAHCCGSKYFSLRDKKWYTKSNRSLSQCYSFYCNKCVTTCGEGGMLATDSEEIANRVRSLSLHGLSSNAWDRFGKKGNIFYDITQPGYKYNLTDIASAMGCSQLTKADILRKKRTNAVRLYKQLLRDNPYAEFLEDEPETKQHSYHLFVIRYKRRDNGNLSRDQLLQSLKENDIVPSVHWKPLHLHSFYEQQGFKAEDFPNATQVFDEIISLPLFPDITEEQIVYVVNTFNKLTHVKTQF